MLVRSAPAVCMTELDHPLAVQVPERHCRHMVRGQVRLGHCCLNSGEDHAAAEQARAGRTLASNLHQSRI